MVNNKLFALALNTKLCVSRYKKDLHVAHAYEEMTAVMCWFYRKKGIKWIVDNVSVPGSSSKYVLPGVNFFNADIGGHAKYGSARSAWFHWMKGNGSEFLMLKNLQWSTNFLTSCRERTACLRPVLAACFALDVQSRIQKYFEDAGFRISGCGCNPFPVSAGVVGEDLCVKDKPLYASELPRYDILHAYL